LKLEKNCKVLLHEFKMGDVEDPEIFAAGPIYDWQQTDEGKWAMENAEDIHWVTANDVAHWGYTIRIFGNLSEKHATFYTLKKG